MEVTAEKLHDLHHEMKEHVEDAVDELKQQIKEQELKGDKGMTGSVPTLPLVANGLGGPFGGWGGYGFSGGGGAAQVELGQLVGFTNAATNQSLTTNAIHQSTIGQMQQLHQSTISQLRDFHESTLTLLQESKRDALQTSEVKVEIERSRIDLAALKGDMLNMVQTLRTEIVASNADTKATLLAQEISGKNSLIDELRKEVFFLRHRVNDLTPSPTPSTPPTR